MSSNALFCRFFPILICSIGFAGIAGAQQLQAIQDLVFTIGQDTVSYPFTGGMNSPQFSEVDLDGDGHEDLFVFDRAAQKVITFTWDTVKNAYNHSPGFADGFPQLRDWALMTDYDQDGVADIFTRGSLNQVAVYSGSWQGGILHFDPEEDTLKYTKGTGGGAVYVNSMDIPSIQDINGDGYPDILTFSPVGGYMYLYESKGSADPLSFTLTDECWGDFYESGLHKSVELDSCDLSGVQKQTGDPKHAGSTVLTLDQDGDQVREVILGDLSFDNLNMLSNGGTKSDAHMTAQDTAFPNYSVPVNLPTFPAAYLVDIDHDGLEDLLVSPNLPSKSVDVHNVWYYRNNGTQSGPAFQFQQQDLFVGNTIDLGSGSKPVFMDYNADSLPDLIISNNGWFKPGSPPVGSSLFLFEHIGTTDTPEFKFVTMDFAGLLNLSPSMHPAFGDLDLDGDQDLLIGTGDGHMHYLENTAGPGNTATFGLLQPYYANIDVGSNAAPQIIDINEDGLPDLLIGEKNGNLNYFENTGTSAQPAFSDTPTYDFFGKVDVRPHFQVIGNSSPFMYKDTNDIFQLLVGNSAGQMYHYTQIENNLGGTFMLMDTFYASIDVGKDAVVSGGDLNRDGQVEIVVGNVRGGLNMYSSSFYNLPSGRTNNKIQAGIKIYPNPSHGNVYIDGLKPGEVYRLRLYDLKGMKIWDKSLYEPTPSEEIPLGMASNTPGIYLLSVESNEERIVIKIIVLK